MIDFCVSMLKMSIHLANKTSNENLKKILLDTKIIVVSIKLNANPNMFLN